jgi:hypothetical protein
VLICPRARRSGGCLSLDGVDDCANFGRLVHALECVGVRREEARGLFEVVAAIIHLGDVEFCDQGAGIRRVPSSSKEGLPPKHDNEESRDLGACVSDGSQAQSLVHAVRLLGVSELASCMCQRHVQTGAEAFTVATYHKTHHKRSSGHGKCFLFDFDPILRRLKTSS